MGRPHKALLRYLLMLLKVFSGTIFPTDGGHCPAVALFTCFYTVFDRGYGDLGSLEIRGQLQGRMEIY